MHKQGQKHPALNQWGVIGAWIRGASCVKDYLLDDVNVDPQRVVINRHSRLSKTA